MFAGVNLIIARIPETQKQKKTIASLMPVYPLTFVLVYSSVMATIAVSSLEIVADMAFRLCTGSICANTHCFTSSSMSSSSGSVILKQCKFARLVSIPLFVWQIFTAVMDNTQAYYHATRIVKKNPPSDTRPPTAATTQANPRSDEYEYPASEWLPTESMDPELLNHFLTWRFCYVQATKIPLRRSFKIYWVRQ